MIIRKASLSDIDILLAFEQSIIDAERSFDSTLKKGHTHYYDLEKLITDSNVEIVVAEMNNEVIGSGYARIRDAEPFLTHQNYAFLGFMYVVPRYRGMGVNKNIIEALKQWIVSRNVTEIRLEVYYANEVAIKAYEKTGFSKHMVEMRIGII
jgi:GNAT superfamily N-acetyltransferase